MQNVFVCKSYDENVRYVATLAGAFLLVIGALLGVVFTAGQMEPATRNSETDALGGGRSIQVLQDGSDWLSEAYGVRKRAQRLEPRQKPHYRSSEQRQRPLYRFSKQRSSPLSYRTDRKLYRTVCVRLCDGYYFPVSFSTTRDRFADDDQACDALCSSDVRLFFYPSHAQDVGKLLDRDGKVYADLANAFLYRTHYEPSCQCRPPPWSEVARQRHAMYATEAWQETAKQLAEAQAREKTPKFRSTTRTGSREVKAATVSGETDSTSDAASYKGIRMSLGGLSGAPPTRGPRVADPAERSWRDRVFNTLTD